jgi:hypothetical protein
MTSDDMMTEDLEGSGSDINEVIFWHSPGETEQNQEKGLHQGRVSNRETPEYIYAQVYL